MGNSGTCLAITAMFSTSSAALQIVSMSNLLSIPFKRTYPIEIQEKARVYIADHGGVHPEEFREDIKCWQCLRENATTDNVHDTRIDSILLYHAQLVSILAKLPSDINLPISYAPVFNLSADAVVMNNLVYERAAVLFNLVALYSHLATAEDRSTKEGITRAASNYQLAAGTLAFMLSSVLPKLVYPASNEKRLYDLSKEFANGLESLMLAQAQECSWQLAKLSNYRNSVIAKIAAGAASFYRAAVSRFRSAPPYVLQALPSDWTAHMESKEFHFNAVAEYRESLVEYEARRHGTELARLTKAQVEAKKAYDIARKGRVVVTVLKDVQSLLETITTHQSRAQRDNDLIYHQDVPPCSALFAIQEAKLVTSNIPKGLTNPNIVLLNSRPLFADLVSWGAREAINIYNDRKKNLIQEKFIDLSRELRQDADEILRKINLPSSLDALERPVGLPPSLLRKAEEVRLENGLSRIQASVEDVERLAQHNLSMLEEALDTLDSEASEDESARKDFLLSRPVSHEANVELIEKSNRYRSILAQAAESDEHIRQKWDEWEASIIELTWEEETLEASIPSSTGSSATPSPQNAQTKQRAQELRMKIEELETLHRDRDQLVRRAQSLAASDDIQPRILAVSSGFERFTAVTPAMFEDVMDEELVKFDRYLVDIADMRRKQKELLDEIQKRNSTFLGSRKDDPAVKNRELALQSLDLAYAKYREIVKNLDEGFKFYNDLSGILMQFKQACRQWSQYRNQELRDLRLARSMQTISIQQDNTSPDLNAELQRPLRGESKRVSSKLPSINAGEWEFEAMKLPPAPGG